MPFDWGEKLLDLVCGGAPGLVKALPAHWRRQASERLKDFNPFATIAANEDLLRGVRLAWIEAALEVDAAVTRATGIAEWQDATVQTKAFSDHLGVTLRTLRHEACDRNVHPGSSAIDIHLDEVLIHVPDFIRAAAGPRPGEVLTRRFVPTLAAVTGWPEVEVPGLYERLANDGLPLAGSSSNRSFGELVFSAFAEIIKNPNRYPEATVAFGLAMDSMARELAEAALDSIGGIDTKIDSLLREVQALPVRTEDLESFLGRVDSLWSQRWVELTNQVARVEGKVDASALVLQQILAAVSAQGQVGPGPNQLAHDTLLALAKRLKPDELLDFDLAVKELEFAVGVAMQVLSQGEMQAGHADRFIDEVLRRVADLTAAGNLEQGATSIADALAELDRREAEQVEALRRQRVGLLDAAIRQAILLRDINRVTKAILAMAAIDCPSRPAASEVFKGRLVGFYVEGRDRGVGFSLAIAISLARLQLDSAETSDQKGEALSWLGNALQTLGERESGTARLEESVQAFRAALEEHTRERVPLDWAATQHDLGNALQALGTRESGTARLEEAIQAYCAALEERTRERVPLDWADTQNSLGNALGILGERESDTNRLEAAVLAYRAALEEATREKAPLGWAMTQSNLGNVLMSLGQRESGTARLGEAVQAYRAALEERTRERVPLVWAATQNNLGGALLALSQRDGSTARLEEAAQAFRAVLEERTRERVPLDWAMTQSNLGIALWSLGAFETGTSRLEEAAQAFRRALEEFNREGTPLEWATTQNNLGKVLTTLGEREGGTARLEEAVQAYRSALEERPRERLPLDWAMTQSNLGSALKTLGERESDTARLEEAVQACRVALEEYTHERLPLGWAWAQKNLASALKALGGREGGTMRLKEAVQASRAALEEHTRERVPLDWAMTQSNLGSALKTLGERESDKARLEEAVQAFRAALGELTREHLPLDWAVTQSNLGSALKTLGERESGTARLEEAVQAYRAALSVLNEEPRSPQFLASSEEVVAVEGLIDKRCGHA